MSTTATIHHTASTLLQPGTVAELRILHTPRNGTVSGYFDNSQAFTHAASGWSGKAPAVYCTLNPCKPALLARSANRLKDRVKTTTSDPDILQRWWLPLDFDPVRPADISSTDDEHEAALQRAAACAEWLTQRGWPLPVVADSGNGGHLLYRIDLPNDDASRMLLQHCLEALALYFSDDVVALDMTVFNAARIWKVYGTMACKGDNLPERPHRLSRLLNVPATLTCVSPQQLAALAALLPTPTTSTPRRGAPSTHAFDLHAWISSHDLPIVHKGPWQQGGTRWVLNPCPWNGEHTNKSAFVVQFASGAIGAGCHHNGCHGKDWHALRDLYEPGWQTPRHTDQPQHPRLVPDMTKPSGQAAPFETGATPPPAGPRAVLIQADTIQEEVVTYLLEPYLPRKMATILDGDPGVGKTGIACVIAASVTRGDPMPDQNGKPSPNPDGPGNVLMVAMEDHLGAVIIPRLKQCGADLSRITFLNETDETGQTRPFTLADLGLLTEYFEQVRPRFVYIDAIQAVLGAKADINRANVVTALLAPLKKLAEQYDCAILCSRHPAKPGQNVAKILYRGMGSQAFVGTVRSGLFVEEHPGDFTKSLLVHYKANAGKLGRTQIFSKAEGKFEWAGASRITHRSLAGDGSPGPLPQQKLKAALWLETRLGTTSVLASELLKEAEDVHDFSPKVLRAAAECIGVTKTQVLGDFLWSLPPLSPPSSSTGISGASSRTGGTGGTGVDWPLQGETGFSLENGHKAPLGRQDDMDTPDTPDTQDHPVHPVLSAEPDCAPNLSPYEDEPWPEPPPQGMDAPDAPDDLMHKHRNGTAPPPPNIAGVSTSASGTETRPRVRSVPSRFRLKRSNGNDDDRAITSPDAP